VILQAIVVIPFLSGLVTLVVHQRNLRKIILIFTAIVHLGLTFFFWFTRPPASFHGWLAVDALGFIFLSITSLLFFAAAFYTLDYLARSEQQGKDIHSLSAKEMLQPEAIFLGCLQLLLATMTLTILSQHVGLLWVAIEATTLVSAPLIYFHKNERSLEATWKYLIICSVGIALGLLGTIFLDIATFNTAGQRVPLFMRELVNGAFFLQKDWLKGAFIFILVGYGTKMGLAPMHTWLPDAHSEAPSVISMLLSATLLNCAFLGILRIHQICVAAGIAVFSQQLFIGFGILSIFVAAVFIFNQ